MLFRKGCRVGVDVVPEAIGCLNNPDSELTVELKNQHCWQVHPLGGMTGATQTTPRYPRPPQDEKKKTKKKTAQNLHN